MTALVFQSTRPRGARHYFHDVVVYYVWVSIHAPTRGATQINAHVLGMTDVSIHAPTRGATELVKSPEQLLFVSIHAPTRGAT